MARGVTVLSDRDKRVIERHRAGETTEAIAEDLGVGRQSVWKILSKARIVAEFEKLRASK